MKMRTYEEYTEKDWEKLSGYDWSGLLREQPIFAKHCDWKKLDGWNWSELLRERPKFAKYCEEHLIYLFMARPELEKFKKYKKQLEKEGKKCPKCKSEYHIEV